MKALAYVVPAKMDGRKVIEPGQAQLIDIPEPQLLPTDDLKIKLEYCAMCATDAHIVTQGLYGLETPWILGHEMMGTVVEINPRGEEYGYKIGDKVVINNTAPCGVCDNCKRALGAFYCTNPKHGSFPFGFAEYCTAVVEQCFKIPENSGIDPKYYCLAEPMSSAMHGIDLADIKIGDTVLLQGCGAIGSIILNMLLLKGCTRVTVSDPVAEKRELALKLGAQYVIDPKNENLEERAMEITGGRGYDIIFDVTGVPAAAPLLPKLIALRGKLMYFAVFPMDYEMPLNLYDLYCKEARVQCLITNFYNYPRVLDLVPRMSLDLIANKEMKLSDGTAILDAFHESKNNKILVKCDA